jgi:catechol 2,3-dioxygenase-like lactoylglutathione lyase family enzyme
MTKKRTDDPWMPAPRYAQTLKGLTVNLLVRDIARALPFHREVLGATLIYSDPDIAVFRHENAEWMLHADHTYDAHPMHTALVKSTARGVGAELRLHGRDPDDAESQARRLGFEIIESSADKPHGLREAFLRDEDGYVWVPDVPTVSTR